MEFAQPLKYPFEWNEILTVICVIFQNEEPLMTNSDNSDFTGMGIVEACLDYVWVTPDKIGALAALDTPPRDVVIKYTSLPSQLFQLNSDGQRQYLYRQS